MSSPSPIEVKVVYSTSSRKRRGGGTARASTPANANRLVLLGVINALLASGLYYGTWWQADPELKIKLLMNSEIPGVDLDQLQSMIPKDPKAKAGQGPAPQRPVPPKEAASGVSARTVLLPATIVGWEILMTVAGCALLLSAGSLMKRSRIGAARGVILVLGLLGLAVLAWGAYADWTKYGRFTPDQLRYDIGIGLALLTVLAALVGHRHHGLTRLAAYTLILSAVGSAAALYICADFDAIKPDELPMALYPTIAVVFVAQSLWGWILLPISSRIGR